MAPEHARAIRERDEARKLADKYRKDLHARMIREAAEAAILKHGGKPKALALHVTRRLTVEEIGDRAEVVVLDESGAPRHGFTVDGLIKEMRTDSDYALAFDLGGASGTGRGQQTREPIANPWLRNSKHHNVTEQMKITKANPELAKQLKAEAGFTVR